MPVKKGYFKKAKKDFGDVGRGLQRIGAGIAEFQEKSATAADKRLDRQISMEGKQLKLAKLRSQRSKFEPKRKQKDPFDFDFF